MELAAESAGGLALPVLKCVRVESPELRIVPARVYKGQDVFKSFDLRQIARVLHRLQIL